MTLHPDPEYRPIPAMQLVSTIVKDPPVNVYITPRRLNRVALPAGGVCQLGPKTSRFCLPPTCATESRADV